MADQVEYAPGSEQWIAQRSAALNQPGSQTTGEWLDNLGHLAMSGIMGRGGTMVGLDDVASKAIASIRARFPKVGKAFEKQVPFDVAVESNPESRIGYPLDWQWHVKPDAGPFKKPVEISIPGSARPDLNSVNPTGAATQTPDSSVLQHMLNILYRTRKEPIKAGAITERGLPQLENSKVMEFSKPWRKTVTDEAGAGDWMNSGADRISEISTALAERMLSNQWKPKPLK